MRRLSSIDELPAPLRELLPQLGERLSGLQCPECGGGASRERSLSMYRIWPNVVLKCYRGKCGYAAQAPYAEGDGQQLAAPRPQFDGELMSLPRACSDWLTAKYRLELATLQRFRVKAIRGWKALYVPVFDSFGHPRGAMVRRYDGWGSKARAYKTTDEPWQGWYRVLDKLPRATVIVEDQMSAMRCWQLGYDAVALLSSDLSQGKAGEIWDRSYTRAPIMLALDADMWSKACMYGRKFCWLHKIVRLDDDIKDCTDEEIEERLT